MKTLLYKTLAIGCASFIAVSVSAPLSAADEKNEPTPGTVVVKEGITMDSGKVMVVKNERKVEITEDMTLKNGTIVNRDGTVTMSDGKKLKLKDGDWVT
ncbi:MAG TPA: DUF6799 domain-containing protein, partial [Candidatus Saccharimonadia bacterium]|nr:DUF6799 domain-containing protein [Candidatus Saccharimonadia bacterium]